MGPASPRMVGPLRPARPARLYMTRTWAGVRAFGSLGVRNAAADGRWRPFRRHVTQAKTLFCLTLSPSSQHSPPLPHPPTPTHPPTAIPPTHSPPTHPPTHPTTTTPTPTQSHTQPHPHTFYGAGAGCAAVIVRISRAVYPAARGREREHHLYMYINTYIHTCMHAYIQREGDGEGGQV